MARRIGVWIGGAALALACSGGPANTQTIEGATFDAASVRPNRSGETRLSVNTQAGRFVAINAPLILLIRLAYAVPEDRIVNTPDWVRGERFDIVATTGGPVERERQNAMLRNLLGERFRLVARIETRQLPIYALVRARPDDPLYPKLRPSPTDCAALSTAARPGTPLPPSNRILCGVQGRPDGVSIGGMSMGEVAAQVLTPEAGRLVIDRTGLEGPFDFDLDFTRTGAPAGATAPDGVPLVTALQEQLGLRLEPQRGPVEVVVIDNIERPTPD
jgi:uncharacterized protein (TIGR03435 family)